MLYGTAIHTVEPTAAHAVVRFARCALSRGEVHADSACEVAHRAEQALSEECAVDTNTGEAVALIFGTATAIAVRIAVRVAVHISVYVTIHVAVDITIDIAVAVHVTVGVAVDIDIAIGIHVGVHVAVHVTVHVDVPVGTYPSVILGNGRSDTDPIQASLPPRAVTISLTAAIAAVAETDLTDGAAVRVVPLDALGGIRR